MAKTKTFVGGALLTGPDINTHLTTDVPPSATTVTAVSTPSVLAAEAANFENPIAAYGVTRVARQGLVVTMRGALRIKTASYLSTFRLVYTLDAQFRPPYVVPFFGQMNEGGSGDAILKGFVEPDGDVYIGPTIGGNTATAVCTWNLTWDVVA